MEMIMRALLAAAAAALVLSAGAASAAPRHQHHHDHGKPGYGKVTAFERLAIARGKVKVAFLQRKARADGRVTPYERAQIRQAQADLNRLIVRARRT
jgi:hypothetical protein